MRTYKTDNKVMDILGIKEISRIIGSTNMGILTLRLRKGETNYRFVLDAVELSDELNDELMEAIYPKEVITSGYMDARTPEEREKDSKIKYTITTSNNPEPLIISPKNKGGRPKKS